MDFWTNGMRQTAALARLQSAYATMALSAGEVMWRRSLMMAQGAMTAPEAARMVLEKPAAFADSAQKAAMALARGANPARVAEAALRPYGRATRANARRLAR